MDLKPHQLYDVIVNSYDETLRVWHTELTDQQKNHLSRIFLVLAARLSFHSAESARQIFRDAEQFGVHFLPVHYYSPLPSLPEINPDVYQRRYDKIPGLEVSRRKHLEWLMRLGRHASELQHIPKTSEADAEGFFWDNPAICPGDAAVYYAMIRELKPGKIVEIGAGYSSLIALQALRANGSGSLTCVEPYPLPHLKQLAQRGEVTLIERRVQDIPLEVFSSLSENGILFIDSSHVSKIGSDVNHEIFEILPKLSPGVFCHFHDMFFPWEFPKNWIEDHQLFWNEQYLVMAFLAYNDRFTIEISNQFVGLEMAKEFHTYFNDLTSTASAGGASLWIQVAK